MPNLGAHPMFAKLPDYDAETDQFNTLNRHYSPRGGEGTQEHFSYTGKSGKIPA